MRLGRMIVAVLIGASATGCAAGLIALAAAAGGGGGGGGGSASVPPRATFVAAPGSPYNVGAVPVSVAIGPFDGANGPDLAVVSQGDGIVSILLQDPNGGFQEDPSPINVGAAPRSVVAADFNGDGKLDLAVAVLSLDQVAVHLGGGDGSFVHAFDKSVANAPQALAVGNLDPANDSIPDLAVVCSGVSGGKGQVSILAGKGNGDFNIFPDVPLANNNGAFAIALGNFDGSAPADFAVANRVVNGTVSIRLGDGTGHFTDATPPEVDVAVNPESVAAGDFDVDGNLDFAVANRGADGDLTGIVSVEYGNGNGSFSHTQFTALQHSNSVAVADFDGDSIPDLAVTSFGDLPTQNGTTVSLYFGKGGTKIDGFTGPLNLTVGAGPRFVAARDLNGDGKPDLVVTGEKNSTVTVLLNTTPP